MTQKPLSATEERVWRAVARLIVALPRTLDEDLQSGAGVSLTHYIVMMSLSEAPGRRLRMSDLAARAALSPSRMSRIVQSLQARGLVSRSVSGEDARTGIATLTDLGLETLSEAWPTHLASVRSILLDQIDSADLRSIAAVIERVVQAAEKPAAARSLPACGEPRDESA